MCLVCVTSSIYNDPHNTLAHVPCTCDILCVPGMDNLLCCGVQPCHGMLARRLVISLYSLQDRVSIIQQCVYVWNVGHVEADCWTVYTKGVRLALKWSWFSAPSWMRAGAMAVCQHVSPHTSSSFSCVHTHTHTHWHTHTGTHSKNLE